MSPIDFRSQHMSKAEVTKLISRLINADANIVYTRHAESQMLERNITTDDVLNVLSATPKTLLDGEEKNGSWSYQVKTAKFTIVVGFTSDGSEIIIVTAWRNEK